MFDKGFAAGPDAAASDEPAAGPVDAPGRVEAMLSALQHLGHVGVWDLDIATGTMWWSDGLYTIHGYPPDSFPASLDRLVANTHPGDRAAFTEQLHALITNGRELDVISRVVRPDSSPRYVHRRGSLLRDSDGNPLRVCATSIDVTDTRVLESERDEALVRLFASEARYRMLAENAWDVIWTMSLDGTVTYVSPSVQRVRGITPGRPPRKPSTKFTRLSQSPVSPRTTRRCSLRSRPRPNSPPFAVSSSTTARTAPS